MPEPAREEAQIVAVNAGLPATFRQKANDRAGDYTRTSEINQRISEVEELERETGFEPATLSLGS